MRQQALILIYILIHKIVKSKGRLKTMNMGIQTTFLFFLRKLYSGLSTFSQISSLSVQTTIPNHPIHPISNANERLFPHQ